MSFEVKRESGVLIAYLDSERVGRIMDLGNHRLEYVDDMCGGCLLDNSEDISKAETPIRAYVDARKLMSFGDDDQEECSCENIGSECEVCEQFGSDE